MTDKTINVLVADDSRVARMLLVHLLESDPQIKVLGAVDSGLAALEFVQQTKTDVLLMDIHMPNLDGFEATRRIMEIEPLPIVICTATTNPREVATTFRMMEAGAVACVEKPVAREHADFEQLVATLLQTVKLMSEVKVVRRWPKSRNASARRASENKSPEGKIQIVGIGASTGGPPVLQAVLAGLPKDFPAPLLIVQHIAPGFLPGLVEWLNQTTAWQVHVASHGIDPRPGHAYLAPDDFHLGMSSAGKILLAREAAENGLRPAVSYLFRSLSDVYGPNVVGVLLTGMGKDGAAELKLMRDRGASTIAQDRETSIVHGMPGEAIALGAAEHILPADKISDGIITIVKRRHIAGNMGS